MMAVVFFILAGGVFVTVTLGFAMFMQEAFAPRVSPVRLDLDLAGLPILTGGSLREWGKRLALEIASQAPRRDRIGNAAVAMAGEVESAISTVVRRIAPLGRRELDENCSSYRCGVIPLTAPEALAIAEDLRQRCSMRTIENIRTKAARNLQSAAGTTAGSTADATCPLFGEGGCCVAHAVRPVFCRGRDFASHVAPVAASPAAVRAEQQFATTLGEGMLVGLASALGKAHYDQHIYELNGAIAAALEAPGASRRWVDGEAIFADCATIDSLAS